MCLPDLISAGMYSEMYFVTVRNIFGFTVRKNDTTSTTTLPSAQREFVGEMYINV